MTTWTFLRNIIVAKAMSPQYYETEECYFIKLYDNTTLIAECVINKNLHLEDKADFEANFKANANQPNTLSINSVPAFHSKVLGSKKLYKRIHGIKPTLSTGVNIIEWSIPYPWVKITAIEIIGGELGDTTNFQILDTDTGLISQTPKAVLNQFTYNINIRPVFYAHKSEFDADLYQGLYIRLEYNSVSAKPLGINFVLNEVKP